MNLFYGFVLVEPDAKIHRSFRSVKKIYPDLYPVTEISRSSDAQLDVNIKPVISI